MNKQNKILNYDSDNDNNDEFIFNIKNKYKIQGKRIGGYIINYIPEKDRTYDICIECVQRHGGALEYVPIQFKTKKLCTLALKTYPSSLRYVPDEYKTYNIC